MRSLRLSALVAFAALCAVLAAPGARADDAALAKRLIDPDPTVRVAAVRSVRAGWDSEGPTAEGQASLRRALAAALDSPDARTRTAAATSLGDLGLGAAPRLIRALKDPAPSVREAALRALVAVRSLFEVGELGPADWRPSTAYRLPPILRMLDDPEPAVRAAALAGVGAYYYDGDRAVRQSIKWEKIVGFTRDPDGAVRREAVAALMELVRANWANWDWRAATEVFQRGLRDPEPGVRAASARWFAWSRNPLKDDEETALVATLRGLLGADDPAVRWSAAWSLWRRTSDPTGLVPIARDRVIEPGDDAFEAARILHEIGPGAKEAVPALVQVLGVGALGMYPGLGAYAAEAMYDIGPDAESALPLLAEALRAPSLVRRWDAAKAIGSLHGQAPKVAGVIAAARAREVDPRVRDALRDALAVVAREDGGLNAVLQSSSLGSEDTDTARDAVRTGANLGADAASQVRRLSEAADLGHRWTTRHSVSTPGRAPFRVDLELSRDAIDALGACGPAARSALPTLRRLRADARLTKRADVAIARIEK